MCTTRLTANAATSRGGGSSLSHVPGLDQIREFSAMATLSSSVPLSRPKADLGPAAAPLSLFSAIQRFSATEPHGRASSKLVRYNNHVSLGSVTPAFAKCNWGLRPRHLAAAGLTEASYIAYPYL